MHCACSLVSFMLTLYNAQTVHNVRQVVELPREDPSKALRTFAAVPNLQASPSPAESAPMGCQDGCCAAASVAPPCQPPRAICWSLKAVGSPSLSDNVLLACAFLLEIQLPQ